MSSLNNNSWLLIVVAIYTAFLVSPGLAQAGVVTGSPVADFTTFNSSKNNVLTFASPIFNANLSTYGSFIGQVHSLLGVTQQSGMSDFEHQDASSPDLLHGDVILPYAMVGSSANGANGTVLYKFVTENGFKTAAGGSVAVNVYFRHAPESSHGDNAWVGVSPYAVVEPNLSALTNATQFNRVTMRDVFPGAGFASWTDTVVLPIPANVTEFYFAFSDYYQGNGSPTFSSGRLAITALTVNANLVDVYPSGDFNQDGRVDQFDLIQWQGDFGLNGESDADHDGDSDGRDFLIWQRNYGIGALETLSAHTVPEPASVLLLGMVMTVMCNVRLLFVRT
jgi:hypothetical protein